MKSKIKVSVQTGYWYDELFDGDTGAEEAFAFIKRCGFETLDYNMDQTLPSRKICDGSLNNFYNADIEELLERYRLVKEAMKHQNISFGQAHAPFPLYVEGNDYVNDYMIKVVEKECAICQYLECPALVVHPYSCDNKEKEKEINLAMYRKMIPAGKKYGVKLCLENMFRFDNGHAIAGACGEAAEACWYIDTLNEEAGEEIFGYCFDVGHANITSRNIRHELRTLGSRLTILHIHDNDGLNDIHQIPYTQHVNNYKLSTDWSGFIEGLRDIDYKGTLNFETFASLKYVPKEIMPILLKFVAEIGNYFKGKIEK